MRVERHGKSRTGLAWQAVLILLPVLLLAGLGAYYLRQDRILVRHEAEQRARTLADDITTKLWAALRDPDSRAATDAFQIDARGNLLFPPPYDSTPAPQPLDLSQLTAEQAALWTRYRADVGWLKEFGQAGPPTNFLANALFRTGLRFAAQGDPDALAAFQSVVRRFPDSIGETGLPLAPLAALKYHEVLKGEQTNAIPDLEWQTLCRRAIEKPSLLTPIILQRAAEARKISGGRIYELHELWRAHERLRALYCAARPALTTSSALFWIDGPAGRCLASRLVEGTNQWITCHAASQIADPRAGASTRRARAINSFKTSEPRRATTINIVETVPGKGEKLPFDKSIELTSFLTKIPSYFGLQIDVLGEPLVSATNRSTAPAPVRQSAPAFAPLKPSSLPPEPLATARHIHDGSEMLKVAIYLIGPDALYAAQTKRVVWFAILIVVSTIAAALALLSLWRNYHRQLRLADLKDNFVSSVSHELRAPIASVRLMAEGLERGRVVEPEKQREYFLFIVQECQRLSALIQNVLDVSRIDLGRKQYDFELANVSKLVEETVNSMQPVANERGIELRTNIVDTALNSVLDARAIQQALVNLIDNALKHSPSGSALVVSAATRHDDARAWLEISVEDHGEGIPAAEHERIFERFYRVGSELRRQTPGAGIGLAIVKEIVAAHRGRVRVQSEPGKGSRFTIELPLKGEEK